MSVFFITPKQAIDVWVHLEQAYCGHHGYGGHTAEVYCYLLETRSPSCDRLRSKGKEILRSTGDHQRTRG